MGEIALKTEKEKSWSLVPFFCSPMLFNCSVRVNPSSVIMLLMKKSIAVILLALSLCLPNSFLNPRAVNISGMEQLQGTYFYDNVYTELFFFFIFSFSLGGGGLVWGEERGERMMFNCYLFSSPSHLIFPLNISRGSTQSPRYYYATSVLIGHSYGLRLYL